MPAFLVSAPNKGGGIAVINQETVTLLADDGHTGVFVGDSAVALARQDQTIHVLTDAQQALNIRFAKKSDIHDVLLKAGTLYAAVTGRNKIIAINTHRRKIINTWQFKGKGDSCHINCLGEINGQLHFSAFGTFLKHKEYKSSPEGRGYIAELTSRNILIKGLSHPHSFICEESNIWVCNSLMQEVLRVSGGRRISSGDLGGYTRGLCLFNNSLFAGVSIVRDGAADSGKTAFIAELDKCSLRLIRKIDMPFKEIYGVTAIAPEKGQMLIENIGNALPDKKRFSLFRSPAAIFRAPVSYAFRG